MNSKQRHIAKRKAFRQGQKQAKRLHAIIGGSAAVPKDERNNPYRPLMHCYVRPKVPRASILRDAYDAGWESVR